jgi:hypothetical protein
VQRHVLYLGEINDTQELACAELFALTGCRHRVRLRSDLSPRPDDDAFAAALSPRPFYLEAGPPCRGEVGHLATMSTSFSLLGSCCQIASVTNGMNGWRSLSETTRI